MAPTSPPALHRLDAAAIPQALRLSAEAGWNQVAEDWAIFFAHGAVHGAAGAEGLLGTGAVLPYRGFGWISMVLVTAAARGQGLGTAILRQAMAALDDMGLVPVLDATPAGERIYRPLGFRPVFAMERWRGVAGQGAAPADIRPLDAEGLEAAAALDAAAFGAPRPAILAGLRQRAPAAALALADGMGFVLARPGRQALQIGPLVAPDEARAGQLLAAALAQAQGPVLLDLPVRWQGLAATLEGAGLRRERSFLRMALGQAEPFGDPARLFLAAGPELG